MELICCGPLCVLLDNFLLELNSTGVITIDVLVAPRNKCSIAWDGFRVKKACKLLPLAVQGNDVSDDSGQLTVSSNK